MLLADPELSGERRRPLQPQTPFASRSGPFRGRAALQLEILALRHPLGVLHRSAKRPKFTDDDRGIAIVISVANGRGKGVYWWEPGNNGARGFFDAGGNTMPASGVFHGHTRPIRRTGGQ